jgi:hypothetical protein
VSSVAYLVCNTLGANPARFQYMYAYWTRRPVCTLDIQCIGYTLDIPECVYTLGLMCSLAVTYSNILNLVDSIRRNHYNIFLKNTRVQIFKSARKAGLIARFNKYFQSSGIHIEVLFVKPTVFILLLFATLPECSQNQTAVSDTLRLLSNF